MNFASDYLHGKRRPRFPSLLFSFIAFIVAPLPVAAEEDPHVLRERCKYYRGELESVNKELHYRQWNPPRRLLLRRESFEKKIREQCSSPPSVERQAGGSSERQAPPGDYVTTRPVTVRSGPGHQFDELASLSRGAKVTVTGSESGWLKLSSTRGRPPGYIPAAYARLTAYVRNTQEDRSSAPSPAPRSEDRKAKPAQDTPPPQTQAAKPEPSPPVSPPEKQPEPVAEASPPASAPDPAPAPAPAGYANAVRDCDILATHPDDPERNGEMSGVDDEHLVAPTALNVCKAAVEQNPQSGRLLFQLGRCYWVGERFEEAIETFLEAGERGHGGALAYLGDATLYGLAGLDPDPEEAKNLYRRAAAAGFKPAAALADEIVEGVEIAQEEEEQEEQAEEPEYHHPKVIAALARGTVEFDGKLSPKEQVVYMMSLLAGVQHACPSIIPARFNSIDLAAHMGAWLIQRFGFVEATMFNADVENGVYESTNQEGLDDGYTYVSGYECNSGENRTFVTSISGYFS